MKLMQQLQFVDAVARAGSIRKAAEHLAITSTALNRRILAIEEEMGVAVFERLPHGVRLSTAGELMIQFARTQLSDFDRLKSQIADLSGIRRGSVSIASTRAGLPFFLPEQIGIYRTAHPGVTFRVNQRSREEAEHALAEHTADLALAFEPAGSSDFQTLTSVPQRVTVIMPADHPLAQCPTPRLRDCVQYPLGLPSGTTGVRHLLELASARLLVSLQPEVESEDAQFLINHALKERAITFDIPLGLSESALQAQGMVLRPLDKRDAPEGRLYLGQLKGRILPVAAAKFANQLIAALDQSFNDGGA